jgi:Icc-related predicted phosphoesterase
MINITCISDTHTKHRELKIEPCDILLYAGDAMSCGYKREELTDFLSWFEAQPARYKVMIAGNHDRYVENFPQDFKEMMHSFDVIYLEDSYINIEGFKVYGTPHSKIFYNWAFNRNEDQLEDLFDKIPVDTDILLSHAPPYGMLDELERGERVGEVTLKNKMKELTNLKLHVYGHIHTSFGLRKPTNKHISVNAAQVDETYELTNFPIVVNI